MPDSNVTQCAKDYITYEKYHRNFVKIAEAIAREEEKKVRRDVFTTMAQTDKKQLRNMRKIASMTEELRKTVREHNVELAMSRAASYLELETEKIIATLHSLLTPSGTWKLGDPIHPTMP